MIVRWLHFATKNMVVTIRDIKTDEPRQENRFLKTLHFLLSRLYPTRNQGVWPLCFLPN